MPNIKGAWKRMRTAERARAKNKAVRTVIKHVRHEVLEKKAGQEGADAVFRKYCSLLDKGVKQGVISRNTAIRRKRRAAARLTPRAAPAPAATPAAPAAPQA